MSKLLITFGIRMDKIKRLPRKVKKQIPIGNYCYTGIKFDWKTGVYYIKTCKFYKHIYGLEGHCKLINAPVDDQYKSCRFKWDK